MNKTSKSDIWFGSPSNCAVCGKRIILSYQDWKIKDTFDYPEGGPNPSTIWTKHDCGDLKEVIKDLRRRIENLEKPSCGSGSQTLPVPNWNPIILQPWTPNTYPVYCGPGNGITNVTWSTGTDGTFGVTTSMGVSPETLLTPANFLDDPEWDLLDKFMEEAA